MMPMSAEDKVREAPEFPPASQTLEQLGAINEEDVKKHFKDFEDFLYGKRADLISKGAENDKERETKCWELRNFVLARHGGYLARVENSWLREASPELKPIVGRLFNELKPRVLAEFDREALMKAVPVKGSGAGTAESPIERRQFVKVAADLVGPPDLTLPGCRRPVGSIHPVTRMQREIEEIFLNLGYWIEEGPEIESVYYNFDALNIPETHPSRDDWDTLYIDSQMLLRAHTSPVQIRAMKKYGPPLYIIIPGKCYRHDNPDSSHSPMFHQIEGLAIDKDITFADLKGTLDFFAKKLFGEKIRTRFQPSFFPFTEPSGEVAINCTLCDGRGCPVCKESGWVEVMGCGMVHPVVLRNGGVDPAKYSGWAFGLGVDRYALMKYGISDIQLLFQSDVRFLEQF
jgi:phenylalanyl-tRNA synthetase alpha chain